MFTTADQFSNATKASIDAQIAAMNDFANKTLHSMAELVELNIATAKASLEHSSAAAQQILSAKDAQEVFALTSSQAQPNAEKALAYGRHVASIRTAAIAHQFGVNPGAAFLGVLVFFEHHDTSALPQHKTVTVFVPRA